MLVLQLGICTCSESLCCLTAKAIQCTTLTLQRVDDVHRRDRLPLGVLSVGDSITDDVLKEDLEDAASLLVDQTRDTLDTTTTSQTTDGGLCDALDVVSQYLTMTLGASFAESLSAFAATRHYCCCTKLKSSTIKRRIDENVLQNDVVGLFMDGANNDVRATAVKTALTFVLQLTSRPR